MKLRSLLIDDEFLALQILEEYCSKLPNVQVVGKARSAIEAIELLKEQEVDLLFLDIQMPQLKGTSFLKTLHKKPMVIFTTAYPQYAVEAFDLKAIDYLTKPIAFERFVQAVNKAEDQYRLEHPAKTAVQESKIEKDFLVIKEDYKWVKIAYADILYIEGFREYVRIVTHSGKKHLFLESMKNLEDTLPEKLFLRVHRSYIIAKKYVKAVSGNTIELGELEIPIGRTIKDEVMKRIFS